MSPITQKITEMVDMLSEQEQNLAFEFIKRMLLAWDPDFTKATPTEAADIEQAFGEIRRGESVSFSSAEAMATHFGVS